jgi:hypothetical protein
VRQLRADDAAADAQRREVRLVAESLGQLDAASRFEDQLGRGSQDCLGV